MILDTLTALAEPTRLTAMQVLWDGGEHCVCEMMELTGTTQSRMSRHMQVLKQAGLVLGRRDAQWVRFRLNPDMPEAARAVLAATMAALEESAAKRDQAA